MDAATPTATIQAASSTLSTITTAYWNQHHHDRILALERRHPRYHHPDQNSKSNLFLHQTQPMTMYSSHLFFFLFHTHPSCNNKKKTATIINNNKHDEKDRIDIDDLVSILLFIPTTTIFTNTQLFHLVCRCLTTNIFGIGSFFL